MSGVGIKKTRHFYAILPSNLSPDAPCLEYVPRLAETWPHSRGNGLANIPYLHGATWIILANMCF